MVKLQGEFELVLSHGGEVSGKIVEDPAQVGTRAIELTWNPASQHLTSVDGKRIREAQDLLRQISEALGALTVIEAP